MVWFSCSFLLLCTPEIKYGKYYLIDGYGPIFPSDPMLTINFTNV